LIPVASQPDYTPPIDAATWASQFVNTFTVVGGVVTSGDFHADNTTSVSTLDRLFLNSGPCTSGATCSYLSLGSNNTLNVWHGVAGTTFTPTIPESSTWAMMVLGFAGLGYAGYRSSRKGASIAA
jgi:hypothetical protein